MMDLSDEKRQQMVNIPKLAAEINQCFVKLLPNPLLIRFSLGAADTIDEGLAKIRDNLLAVMERVERPW